MGKDETKRMILARRARFIAATLASVAATTTGVAVAVEGCGGDTVAAEKDPQPCLGITCEQAQGCAEPSDSGTADAKTADAGADSTTTTNGDSGLTDASTKDVATTKDTGTPLPCLAPPLGDF